MKKIFLAFAAIFSVLASAQVTFRPVIRLGANFSHFTSGDYRTIQLNNQVITARNEFDSRTDFYFGVAGALKLSKVYTLQPELDYSRQGGKLIPAPSQSGFYDNNGYPVNLSNSSYYTYVPNNDFKVSYFGVQLINKFNVKKFNIHLGPGVDFRTDSNFNLKSDIDLTFIGGMGFEIIENLGVEARIKKGILSVAYINGDYPTNVVFSLGATYKLDFK